MRTYFFTWLLSLFDFPVIKTGPNRITPRKVFHFRYWTNEKNILPIFQKVLESLEWRKIRNFLFRILSIDIISKILPRQSFGKLIQSTTSDFFCIWMSFPRFANKGSRYLDCDEFLFDQFHGHVWPVLDFLVQRHDLWSHVMFHFRPFQIHLRDKTVSILF